MSVTESPLLIQSGTNDAFLNDLYSHLLNRAADASGFQFWEQQLLQGASREVVVSAFASSKEFLINENNSSDLISRLYSSFLDRVADSDGKSYWDQQIKNGISVDGLTSAFMASEEFKSHTDIGSADIIYSRDPYGREVLSSTDAFNLIEGGKAASFYVSLAKKPSQDVKLYIETDSPNNAQLFDDTGIDQSRVFIKFNADNWFRPQHFSIAAKDDGIAQSTNSSWKIHALTSSEDSGYKNLKSVGAFAISEQNVNVAGVHVEKDFDVLTPGQKGYVTISLTSKPTEDVNLTLHGVGGTFDFNGLPAYLDEDLKFTSSDWNIAKKVLVEYNSPIFDFMNSNQKIEIDAISKDANYNKSNLSTLEFSAIKPISTLSDAASINDSASTVTDQKIADVSKAVKSFASFLAYDLNDVQLPFVGVLGSKTLKLQADITTMAEKLISGSSNNLEDSGFNYNLETNAFTLNIKNSIPILNAGIASDLGVDGLSFSMDGKINGKLDYNLNISGGWDLTNGVFLNQSTSKFNSTVEFDGQGLKFTGMLGPLSVEAQDQNSSNSNSNNAIGDTGAKIALNLGFKTDSDGKLSVMEAKDIVSGKTKIKDAIDIDVKGDAQLSFGVTTKADLPTAFNAVEKYIPTYTFDFTAPFQFQYSPFDKNGSGSAIQATIGDIYLDNTQLNVSQFVRDQIQPVVSGIEGFLKPLFPVVNYLLGGVKPWDISTVGDSLATTLSSPLKQIPLFGDKIAGTLSTGISDASQLVENAYIEIFKSFDGLSAYNQQTPFVKDNLISPYELVRSSANLLYNLAFDRDQTISGIQNTAEASIKQVGLPDVVITATKAAISALFDQYAPNTQSQKDYAVTLKASVDDLGTVLTTVQKIEKIVEDVKQFQADGVIALGDHSFNIGSNTTGSNQSVNLEFNQSIPFQTIPANTNSITGKFNALISDMKDIGFEFPVLNSMMPLVKTIALQQADFATFTPNLPPITVPEVTVPFSVLSAFGVPPAITDLLGLKLDLILKNSLTLDANLSFGVDNQGIIDWTKSGYSAVGLANLLDGFYLKDLNQPEFSLDMTTKIGAVGAIKTPGFSVAGVGVESGLVDINANAFLRLMTGIDLDVKDSGGISGIADGKVRPSEVAAFVKNGELPFDIAASLKLFADLGFKGVLDITKFPGPDILQPTITIGSDAPKILPIGSYDLLLGA